MGALDRLFGKRGVSGEKEVRKATEKSRSRALAKFGTDLGVLALLLLFLAQGQVAHAANVTVDTTGSGVDTIVVPVGTYTLSIAGAGEDANASGDLDITANLTINGAGGATTIIDGAGLVRVFEVAIDIKPGSDPNSINPKSKGKIPVAILSGPGFDATTEVDKTSLTFGKTGYENSLKKCTKSDEDVNSDGLLDIVCHFNTQDADFEEGDTAGILKGRTVDGVPIEGRDSVRIVR